MAIFRTKSSSSSNSVQQQKITEKDISQYKVHTANLHDPILTAVNEAQPFEQAANPTGERRQSYLSQENGHYRDIFGQTIGQADMSNPARARNERPLDTIRGFEYAITGDANYRDQLETRKLGWAFHEDFPYYNLQGNGGAQGAQEGNSTGMQPPVHTFDGEQGMYQAENYSANSLKADKKKKKKGGLFGRKK
ncbi:hypothetical protein CAAN1_31S00518 [[Candida] anglica]|uniref:Uncharacterized protein n=1 Tax=[Candida] anglica TaxID=148631 RepID=A0ABP0EH74_9ASCO